MAARVYWLDTSVYITAKQGPYRFNVFGVFWAFLSEQLDAGTIRSPKLVYQEIVSNEQSHDDLAIWAKSRRGNGLCVSPSAKVQDALRKIGDYVASKPRYPQPQKARFLSGADPWLIAHALVDGGVVVTLETDLKPESQKVRIPDVCTHFGVRCINTSDMLEELGAKFSATRSKDE